MNYGNCITYNLSLCLMPAICTAIYRAALHRAFLVLEGNPALMNLRLMQSLSDAQNAGNTLVLGVPGFVLLKNGKAGSSEHKPEDGAS